MVTKAVDNQDASLKEYTIATEVFGRSNNYDSRSDSVVRVQAGRLRSKLQEYYATEGKHDKILIDLPKGHYSPTFAYIEGTNGSTASEGLAPEIASIPVKQSAIKASWTGLAIGALALLAFALGVLAFNYKSDASRLKDSLASKTIQPAEVQAASPLWGDFFHSPEPVLVAFSNALFRGTAETGMKVLKPMGSAPTNVGSPAASQTSGVKEGSESVVTDHYTGIGEVLGVYSLGDLFYKASRSIRVKRSLMLTWDDLKTENIIILGSPAENFVLRDLPQQQDFVFQPLKDDKQNMSLGIVNTKPKTGEQPTYLARQEGPSRSQISEDYAVISLLRGLDEKHRLMILAGITTFGTQAAAEYVTKPEHIKDLITHLDTSQSGDSPKLPLFYQVLIKVKVNGGVPVQISYVTHHVL
ncbi:MAG TPA: hypothetical protein VLR90_21820 [Blastocatellia bacterium]|nr:hypothetical protein [Blastocatellia bacterium]